MPLMLIVLVWLFYDPSADALTLRGGAVKCTCKKLCGWGHASSNNRKSQLFGKIFSQKKKWVCWGCHCSMYLRKDVIYNEEEKVTEKLPTGSNYIYLHALAGTLYIAHSWSFLWLFVATVGNLRITSFSIPKITGCFSNVKHQPDTDESLLCVFMLTRDLCDWSKWS